MKKLTPQIAAMYLGTNCQYKDEDGNEMIAPLLTINLQGYAKFVDPEFDEWIELKDVKPILRQLQDMSEDEARELFVNKWPEKEYQERFSNVLIGLLNEKDNSRPVRFDFKSNADSEPMRNNLGTLSFNSFSPNQWLWLISKFFDPFGLIASGKAIDAKTL